MMRALLLLCQSLVGTALVQALPRDAKFHQYHGRELADGEVVIMGLELTNQSLRNERLEVVQTKPSGSDAVYGFELSSTCYFGT